MLMLVLMLIRPADNVTHDKTSYFVSSAGAFGFHATTPSSFTLVSLLIWKGLLSKENGEMYGSYKNVSG